MRVLLQTERLNIGLGRGISSRFFGQTCRSGYNRRGSSGCLFLLTTASHQNGIMGDASRHCDGCQPGAQALQGIVPEDRAGRLIKAEHLALSGGVYALFSENNVNEITTLEPGPPEFHSGSRFERKDAPLDSHKYCLRIDHEVHLRVL
jgi:hypothetical protein